MDSLTPDDRVAEAMRDIQSLCDFAYERGFHEMGYDPVSVVRRFVDKATEELTTVQREIDVPSEALSMRLKVSP